ncbi:protein phosphatase 1D isoform X2 [Periplaneta americana]|uniref:protein phosphatase 1D isoform X2 n=1 Tax=Periplaneta americana TaxID=6978 RepID=UPI0037E7EC26
MAPSIGVNLRVTGHCSQGGRKYMEDMFSVAYQQTEDEKDLEYAFFGIFDGHGGREAATFAKEHLMDYIVNQKGFWSDKDEDILRAIRDGFLQTHLSMWGQLESWPKTASGLPSTSGTTASVAFIRKGKIYIGHVGDSSIVLGYQDEGDNMWKGRPLTRDHKPESEDETARIMQSGGKVVSKSGVPRVVWNRPRLGHRGPVRRSTHIDEIPFLAVARSLGDLWSYNSELDQFVVSPEPDVGVVAVEVDRHRCLIFGTDGLWNMLSPNAAVAIVQAAERHNEKHVLEQHNTSHPQVWINPSKSLVDRALDRWSATRLRADNTSVVTLMLDPPGPPRAQVLLSQKQQQMEQPTDVPYPQWTPHTPTNSPSQPSKKAEPECSPVQSGSSCSRDMQDYDPTGGVAIFTRYPVATFEGEIPDSSSTLSTGRVCKVGSMLHRETKAHHSAASVQINEVSSSNLEDVPFKPATLVRQRTFSFGSENSRCSLGGKRRHSSMAKLLDQGASGGITSVYEPCPKRRTRSEDKRLSAPPTEDELNTSDVENERVAWPGQWHEDHKVRLDLEKKILQRPSSTGGRLKLPSFLVAQARGTTRMLRSDTAAALPIRTLRSRNINIEQSNVKSVRKTSHSSSSSGRHRQTCWGGIVKPRANTRARK